LKMTLQSLLPDEKGEEERWHLLFAIGRTYLLKKKKRRVGGRRAPAKWGGKRETP